MVIEVNLAMIMEETPCLTHVFLLFRCYIAIQVWKTPSIRGRMSTNENPDSNNLGNSPQGKHNNSKERGKPSGKQRGSDNGKKNVNYHHQKQQINRWLNVSGNQQVAYVEKAKKTPQTGINRSTPIIYS